MDIFYNSIAVKRYQDRINGNFYWKFTARNGSYPQGATEENVTQLNDLERTLFGMVFAVILVITLIGNVAAIVAIIKRKNRFFQKTYMISLCLSDLLLAAAYGTNNMETFSHSMINWTLGSFMCSAIPILQMFGVVASTGALVVIALDRYRNVVHALTKQWNPSALTCVICAALLWLIGFGISYPMGPMYTIKSAIIVFFNETGTPIDYQSLDFCVSMDKHELYVYYTTMAVLIFGSMFCVFMWLYYNIAKLVWIHRKPISHRYKEAKIENSFTVETTTATSTTQTKTRHESATSVKPRRAKKSIHVERKIRTFKVIVCLMVVFFVCRLPFWVFNIIKLTDNSYSEHYHWILTYFFNALALLNCALNPFMYTFLETSVKVLNNFNDCMCNVCCCCCSNTDFEEFEKENPFIVEKYEKKPSRIRFDTSPEQNKF